VNVSGNAVIFISLCAVSLPLFIGIGFIMERYLKNKDYEIRDGASPDPGAPPSRQGEG
jgi:hypothetical protein